MDYQEILSRVWSKCQAEHRFWRSLRLVRTLYSAIRKNGPRFLFSAVSNRTEETYVVKMIQSGSQIPREVQNVSHFRHPNIVHFEKVWNVGDWWILCMKFAELGDGVQLIEREGKVNERIARKLIVQLLDALKTLHSIGIVHRDVKLDNLLITQNFSLILTDFEFSQKITNPSSTPTPPNSNGPSASSLGGTFIYSSPEVREGIESGFASDIWSTGVTLFSLVYGRFPFSIACLSEKGELEALKKAEKEIGVSPSCKDLIQKMLALDPKKRISVHEALSHPWCTGERDHGLKPMIKVMRTCSAGQISEKEREKEKDKIGRQAILKSNMGKLGALLA